ncbi:hypothetical protein PLESTB_000133600 [Pleodorina starrii]|uniref:Apple domain-containing protein n=1 Tax=Pleodorina starrii TaxID=330485 RepID=A0A9W6BBK7_9CHLO|nr:hypothetical protein PLESTB_000133600 [Pleodorina starrii]GLC74303.1 hypothetical protein PLESTF_001487000 [Pleodorina starrii]
MVHCSLLQYGVALGSDATALSTSAQQPNEGACCQACFTDAACIHWDFDLGSRTCRLRADRSTTKTDAAALLRVRQDGRRVAGSRNGVSTYLTHPRYSSVGGFTADKAVRWISSVPTVFAQSSFREVMATAWSYSAFYKTFLTPPPPAAATSLTAAQQQQQQQPALLNVTLTIVADVSAIVLVNGQEIGQTAAAPLTPSVLRFQLPAGSRNLIVLQCKAMGAAAVVAASLVGPDGSVLARTDHTWLWL